MIQTLLDSSEDSDVLETIRMYYHLEDQRFSNLSQEFFRYIKKVFKYDHFDKRDGSIISCLKTSDSEAIETDKKLVHEELMKTMKELQCNQARLQAQDIEFPTLSVKSEKEMEDILSRLWNGKAIAWDAVTDSIFHPQLKEHSAAIFRDLWANLKRINRIHFESRLIPLNKVHPNIPTRIDMRPIVVTSPIVKLVEASLLPELTQYRVEKLHVSQTGFVPGNGIFVNIHRAIYRIKMRTEKKLRCYGIFIDFSSAYNTLDHETLFELLTPILGKERTQMVRAVYARMKITFGKEKFTPNQGVAQGSVISPALFNIYAEGLLKKIEEEDEINFEDILAYADDTLVICDSLQQVRKVIQTIREWTKANNLKLNEKKSGIVEFIGRRMSKILKESTFEGLPVCNEYKYLGLKLTNKLYMTSQLEYIKAKSQDIHRRLAPFLYKADLDTKKNMWQVFVQPLCESILPLYWWEKAKGRVKNADTTIRKSFKLFTGLVKNTDNKVVDKLSGYNFGKRAEMIKWISYEKWDARKRRTVPDMSDMPRAIRPEKFRNFCKRMPREIIQYINLSKSLCTTCHTPNSVQHMETKHGKKLMTLSELLEMTEETQEDRQIPRRDGVEAVRALVKPQLAKFKRAIEEVCRTSLVRS